MGKLRVDLYPLSVSLSNERLFMRTHLKTKAKGNSDREMRKLL